MEAFIARMFLLILLITLGACGKQAPKKIQRIEVTHFVVVFPAEDFDTQSYDLAEEN